MKVNYIYAHPSKKDEAVAWRDRHHPNAALIIDRLCPPDSLYYRETPLPDFPSHLFDPLVSAVFKRVDRELDDAPCATFDAALRLLATWTVCLWLVASSNEANP